MAFVCLRKLAEKLSKHSQKAQVEQDMFCEYFCLGITPDYSTNGGRVIDTLYLEEKGKK